jgi:hypothetical protein
MKKIILAGLMAATAFSAVAPAMAQQGDGSYRGAHGRENGDQRGDGGRSSQRGPREAQQQPQQQPQQQRAPIPTVQDQQRQRYVPNGDLQNQRGQADAARQAQWRAQQSGATAVQQDRRDWRNDQRDGRQNRGDVRADPNRRDRAADRGNIRDDRRDVRNDQRNGRWNDGRPGFGGGGRMDDRQRWASQRRWDNGWRNDRRYDWQQHRNSYRNVYHVGRYNAPRGWSYGYRTFSVGIYLDSLLYSNNYWLDDPYEYRLPPAYGSMRWIRYYDDALLVDTRDGYVVDVIRTFFW